MGELLSKGTLYFAPLDGGRSPPVQQEGREGFYTDPQPVERAMIEVTTGKTIPEKVRDDSILIASQLWWTSWADAGIKGPRADSEAHGMAPLFAQ